MKMRQLDECIDYILKGKDDAERVQRALKLKQEDATFWGYMLMGVQSKYRIECIPEGMPETVQLKKDIPAGMGITTLRNEFRRVKNFIKGGSMENHKAFRREMVWLQMLEGLHYKEAELITQIKDQTLLGLYPQLVEILPKIGIEIDVPLAVPTTEQTEEVSSPDSSPVVEPEVASEIETRLINSMAQAVEIAKAEKPKKERKKKEVVQKS